MGKEGKTKEEVEERWCVTKLSAWKMVCGKDGVVKDGVCVCDKVVCERRCVKDGVWQSCVSKMVCEKLSVTVCQRWCVCVGVKDVVSKMVCDKGVCVCERWCVKIVCDKVVCERWCVKDGVWKMVLMVCDKVLTKMVCHRWCVKDGVWQSGVWKIVCDKVVCERWCVKVGGRGCLSCGRLLLEALCTAPATREAAAAQRRPRVLRLPRERQPHCTWVSEWVSEWRWVSERVMSDEWRWRGGGGGWGGGSPGGIQAKNKNPTQWCGEWVMSEEARGDEWWVRHDEWGR